MGMPSIKNLPLEEKFRELHVFKLPFSKEVKNELYSKGVRNLGQIADKFLHANSKYQGRYWLPGFKDKVFAETCYLLVAMGLDYAGYKEDAFMRSKVGWYVDKGRKDKIKAYTNSSI